MMPIPGTARTISDPVAETAELASRRHPSSGGWPTLISETRQITVEGKTRLVHITVTAEDAPAVSLPPDLGLHLAAQVAANWPPRHGRTEVADVR
jgi:hypothetical protein